MNSRAWSLSGRNKENPCPARPMSQLPFEGRGEWLDVLSAPSCEAMVSVAVEVLEAPCSS